MINRKHMCQFSQETVELYRFVFSKNRISSKIKKLEVKAAMPRPTTPKDICSFLCMTNYMSRFTSEYADTRKSPCNLTKKTTALNLDEREERAIKEL